MALSKRLIGSYIFDWVIIIIFAAAGGGLNYVTPTHRPFSLLDLNLSYPLVPESVTTGTLAGVALAAPAAIIILVCLIFVPGAASRRSLNRSQLIKRKLWEVQTGLAGLALSLALAFFITQGLKNLFGKPRPHFLAVCNPDLSNIAAHVVGGYGQDISERWTMVDSSICRPKPGVNFQDGFRSFPSGHSSFSWSGLLYLSIFIASKFAVAIPYLGASSPASVLRDANASRSSQTELLPLHHPAATGDADSSKDASPAIERPQTAPIYNQAATPPNWGLIFVLIPVAVAAYITATRFSEFYHFGFDILSGAFIGIVSAWFSFRWYHLPMTRGQGWAWGPRSRDRAFAIGVGVGNYVGPEGWYSARSSRDDLEAGRH